MIVKRSLFTLLVVLASFSLAACGGSSSSSSNDTGPAAESTAPGDGEEIDYTDAAQEAKVVDQLKSKEKPNAEMLEFTVSPTAVTIKLRKADDSAYGYLVDQSGFHDVKVEVSGSGSLKDRAYPISKLNAASYTTLLKNLKSKVSSPITMNSAGFAPNIATGELQWNGSYDTAKRKSLSYQASPDGKNIRLIG